MDFSFYHYYLNLCHFVLECNNSNNMYYHISSLIWIFFYLLIFSENESVLVTQLCLALCEPMDRSPPGSSVHGILQARVLEWVAIFFFRDLPHPGTKTGSPALQADSLLSDLLRNRCTEESSRNRFTERQYLLTENVCGFPYLQSHSQVVLVIKSLPASAGDMRDKSSIPGSGRSSGGWHGYPTPVFLPGESHEQRSLAGYSPWCCKELDTTEITEHSTVTFHIFAKVFC